MSEHSLFHGWKSRIFYLTRNRGFLLRTAFGIVAAGFVIGCLLARLQEGRQTGAASVMSVVAMRMQEEYGRLWQATSAEPRELSLWLAAVMERMHDAGDAERRRAFDEHRKSGRIVDHDVRALLDKHTTTVTRGLFEDFITGSLLRDAPEGTAARQRIETMASAEAAPACANELAASLSLQRGDMRTALGWLLREGMLHADAAHARKEAVMLALDFEDADSLRQMRAIPGWIEGCSPHQQTGVGGILSDVPLQWKGMLLDHFTDIPWVELLFSLLAGGVWAVILVQHDQKDAWRWFRPVLPLIAGVASIWPTVSMLFWQQHVQGLVREGDELQRLLFFVAGVGAREEICKLALFALFLPWLLTTRVPGRALLTGAFVGLGFAIEENVQYFHSGGPSAVLSRLLTANFFHLALTGITGHALYRMFRSGFATAAEFVATFAGVIVAHGIYDWLIETDIHDMGLWLSMALFFVIAIRFFDLLSHEVELKRSTVSLRAVFILGCALIVALVFIHAGLQSGALTEIAKAGSSCAGIVPVAILYWRRFEHA